MNERLKLFIVYLRISQKDFADSIGVTRQQLENWLNQKVKIPLHSLVTIAETYSELNLSWFLTGKGSMISDEENKNPRIGTEEMLNKKTRDDAAFFSDEKLIYYLEIEKKYHTLNEKYIEVLEELMKYRIANKNGILELV